jgi:Domain of unknown function (DUF4261)
MPKGIFTQCTCILLEQVVTLDQLTEAMSEFEIAKRVENKFEQWHFGGPSLVVPYQPEKNGLVTVDIVNQKWPDHMGDPKKESMLFGAWTMGYFGPYAYPGGLLRAGQQCWTWQPGRTIVDRHNAFVRVRSSYALGAKDDDPIRPDDYQALDELEFVTKITSALLDVPGSLCYFNPNGEVLLDQDGLRETLNYGWSNDLTPLDAWSNIRMFLINPEWTLMDIVGNGQLDIPDVEACFFSDDFECNEVHNFLLNVSLYLLKHGEVIKEGDTMDGPGELRWQSHSCESLCDPPRKVLRWLPMDDRPRPQEVAGEAK